ncbi:MAG: hypothetical protein GY856_46720 [bacterium]|nr:hypothetical protein [bacterium]
MANIDSVKNRMTRTEKDPWACILTRRPDSYRIPEIGDVLIEAVDYALFERKLDNAVRNGVVLEKWAERDTHFTSKAQAVLGSVSTACGALSLADEKLRRAKRGAGGCSDCLAQYNKRMGTFLVYRGRPKEAVHAYDRAVKLFAGEGNEREEAQSLLGRGGARYVLQDFANGLEDEERAIALLGSAGGFHLVMASINMVAILTGMRRSESAYRKIEEVQNMLKGQERAERPRVLLRWIRALLLETKGDYKNAGQVLDRVESRLKKLDMKPELRVLFADRARVARSPTLIRNIAKKALYIEDSQRIRSILERIIRSPTPEAIVEWRQALDSYVPPAPLAT